MTGWSASRFVSTEPGELVSDDVSAISGSSSGRKIFNMLILEPLLSPLIWKLMKADNPLPTRGGKVSWITCTSKTACYSVVDTHQENSCLDN